MYVVIDIQIFNRIYIYLDNPTTPIIGADKKQVLCIQ